MGKSRRRDWEEKENCSTKKVKINSKNSSL